MSDRSPSRCNGRMHEISPGDIKLVCTHGHTLWYTYDVLWRDAVTEEGHRCDMMLSTNGDNMRCGAAIRPLTEAEEAAWAIGGFAAVKEIVQPWLCGK